MHHQSAMPEVIENSGRQSTFTQNASGQVGAAGQVGAIRETAITFVQEQPREAFRRWLECGSIMSILQMCTCKYGPLCVTG